MPVNKSILVIYVLFNLYVYYFFHISLIIFHVISGDKIGRTLKTHSCGELTIVDVGKHVILRGFLVFQRLANFIILRDGYGITQAIINDQVINSKS